MYRQKERKITVLLMHTSVICNPPLEGYIFEKFFTIEKIWDRLPFFSQETIYHVCTEMRQSLALLSTVMLDH